MTVWIRCLRPPPPTHNPQRASSSSWMLQQWHLVHRPPAESRSAKKTFKILWIATKTQCFYLQSEMKNKQTATSSRGGRSSQTHRLCSEGHILTQSHEHTEHVQPRPQSNDLTVSHWLDLSSAYWSVCWSISELCMLQDGWRRIQRSTCY